MNKRYLSTQQIGHLAHICNQTLNDSVKKTLKRLEKEYAIEFTTDKQTNVNLLWAAYGQEIMTSTRKDNRYNKTYAEALKAKVSFIEARDILSVHIEYNHKADYEFIWLFQINDLINSINWIVREVGTIYCNKSLKELLYCNDYVKLFSSLYGIDAVDKKALQATQKAVRFFDELLAGIPNKNMFFTELAKYYESNDLSQMHNKLNTEY